MNFEEPFNKIQALARKDGVEVEMLVERGDNFSVSFQDGKPEKFNSTTSHCAGFRVLRNGYAGYAFSENLADEALVAAYHEAFENAGFTAQAQDPSQKAKLLPASIGEAPELPQLFNDSLERTSVEKKLEKARQLELEAKSVDARIVSVPYNGYSETNGELMILTSTGLRRRQRSTAVYGYSYCLAKSGDEGRMASEAFFARRPEDIDTARIARTAARKAVAKLGAAAPESGMYPIVVENDVACELIGLIADYFSAQRVYEKKSIFAKSREDLGQRVGSASLTITDDPFFEGGVGTRSFDAEGAPSRLTTVVENGVIRNLLTNSVYAERMDLLHTANAARGARSELGIGMSNWVVKRGTKSPEDLLKTYPKIILITDFQGYHAGFNEGSGDFSLQAEGELWEQGVRVKPLANFVVAGNIRQLLMDIEDVSNRYPVITSSVIAPDLLIKSLSIAGA
jgi:PmbA protein